MNLKYLKPTVLAVCVFAFFLFGNTVSAAILSKAPNNLGLVGYWSMNEGRGALVGDSSGFGNHATTTNMSDTNWVVGKLGKSLDFSGSSDYASAGVITELSGATKATLAGWLYRPNTSTSVGFGQHVEPYRFAMLWYTDGKVYSEAENGTASYPSFSNSQTGWHHYVMVYDGTLSGLSRINVYWDGILQSLTAGGSDPAAALPSGANQTDFRFGMDDPIAAVRDWDGRLDEVRLYNRALSASEVATLYQSGAAKLAASSANLDNGSSLASGLVGHWTLDGQDTSWGSNTTLDRSGSGNTGTITNMSTTTSPTPGKLGQALKFDGSDDYVNTQDIALSGTFTISYWYKTSSHNQVGTHIGEDSGTDGATPKIGQNNTAPGRHFIRIVTTSATNVNLGSINKWNHAVITRDSSDKVDLYVNGGTANRLFSDVAQTGTFMVDKIGANGDGSQPYSGLIDEVRIYNRALSVTEIAQLYNLGQGKMNVSQNKTGNSLDNGLVGLWSFNGPDISWSANTAYDRSGQGNNGTITNMSTTTSPTPGKVGQALKFDGSDDVVNIGTSATYDNMTQFSACAWAKPENLSIDGNVVGKRNADRGFLFFRDEVGTSCTDCYSFFVSESSTITNNRIESSTGTANNTSWTHLCSTFQANQAQGLNLYLNGASAATPVSTINIDDSGGAGSSLKIGDDDGGPAREFGGSIDEVRIYNRVLSAAEVLQLYRLGR